MSHKLQHVEGVAARRSDNTKELDNALARALKPGNRQELVRFGLAGWQFVSSEEDGEELRNVYRDEAGHLFIEGQYVTLRLKPGVSPGELPSILKKYGLKLKRPIGLKRDMLQAEPAPRPGRRKDLVELCRSIEQDERVDWAEASLIESLPPR